MRALKKGPGRPAGTTKQDSRTKRVYVRVHPEEKRVLERRAAEQGVSVSEFLLVLGLSGQYPRL